MFFFEKTDSKDLPKKSFQTKEIVQKVIRDEDASCN